MVIIGFNYFFLLGIFITTPNTFLQYFFVDFSIKEGKYSKTHSERSWSAVRRTLYVHCKHFLRYCSALWAKMRVFVNTYPFKFSNVRVLIMSKKARCRVSLFFSGRPPPLLKKNLFFSATTSLSILSKPNETPPRSSHFHCL